MELTKFIILAVSFSFGIFHYVLTDGQRDIGEACSLRTQIFNLFRSNDSPEGCMSRKGLVCMNHKCVCADPTNVYEVPEPEGNSGGSTRQELKEGISQASGFLKKLFGSSTTTTSTTTTTAAPDVSSSQGGGGGKCVGRAGSPCFTQNSTCVKNAKCEGSPRICKCQGIYGSNSSGFCSKTANLLNQAIKSTIG